MTDRQQLQHLFQFDLWSTGKLARLYMKEEPFYEQKSVLSLLSHIINTQNIWFGRLFPHPAFQSSSEAWDPIAPEDLYPLAKESTQLWIDFVADHEVDLDIIISYQNSSNTSYVNSIRQICHHLIIHGQHHRAQVSLFLNNSDIIPPPMDYIHYARKHHPNQQ